MKNKDLPWWKVINFYKLIGLVLLWIASWLFMMPLNVEIATPYFNNIWGELLSVIGIYQKQSVLSQQRPDLLSGLIALFIMIILQVRGIFSFTLQKDKLNNPINLEEHKPLTVFLNLLSILIHTLFFTMIIKIFLFPNTGLSTTFLDRLKADIGMTIFAAVSITGMLLGAQSIARIILIIFSAVCVFKNINFVNQALGIWGFVAILFTAAGFYLEFCGGGIDTSKLLLDFTFLIGKYDSISLKAKEESKVLNKKKTGLLRKASKLRQIENENPDNEQKGTISSIQNSALKGGTQCQKEEL